MGCPSKSSTVSNYPGHSAMRMHGLPSRTGRELIDRLRDAAEQNDIVILRHSAAENHRDQSIAMAAFWNRYR
jgi:hypothetical protein